MKKLLVTIITFLSLSYSITFAQSGWVQQNSGVSGWIKDVQFVNENTGWAVGIYDILIKTTNGGVNWFSQRIDTIQSYNTVFFIDSQTGWVAGYNSRFMKTTNGGNNWVIQNVTPGSNFFTIYFINSQTGWAAGYYLPSGGFYMKTTNGGDNWDSYYPSPTPWHNRATFFLDSQTGWLVGDCGIRYTTNNGNNWTAQDTTSPSSFAIQFIDSQTGYTACQIGYVCKTTNKGTNWVLQSTGTNKNLKSLYFLNSQTGWIVGDSGVAKRTTNGGLNWITQNFPSINSFASVTFVNSLTGWIVGSNGIILKTTNGGISSVNQISTEIPSKYSLSQNYPNPFNPITNVKFSIINSEQVKLIVYDVMGREVQTLVNERLQPGTYEAMFDGSALNSGIYFYQLIAEGIAIQTRKMILLK